MTTIDRPVITPTPARFLRRSLFWIGAILLALAIAVIATAIRGGTTTGQPLGADSAAPAGAKALAQVLGARGVDVIATGSLAETRAAIDSAADTTLFVYDELDYLSADQLTEATGLADTVVLASPSFLQLQAVAPGVASAGAVDGTAKADCSVAAVRKAGTASVGPVGYRIAADGAAGSDAQGCLRTGDDVYSLVQLSDGGTELTILGATDALTNDGIRADGNAALALNLLGQHPTLVWYLPGIDDVAATGTKPLYELTPHWVTPSLVLLILAALAAAFWRGRRFGPLVIENLPVTVRASETMLGRARLYATSSARLRALDAIRIGSVQRLAARCGLPRTATVDDVASAVAALTGRELADVRGVLLDAEPTTDAQLVAASDALALLERQVAEAVRP